LKPEFIDFIGNARKRRGAKFRTQLYILIVCFCISLFFWILIRLSRDYNFTLEYRLKYIGVQQNYALAAVSDTVLTLKIRLQGYDYFRELLTTPHERVYPVSLSRTKIRSRGNRYTSYILTQGIARDIVSQTNFPSELVGASPDTLFFEFRQREK